MRIAKNFCLVLGLALILFNLLAYANGHDPFLYSSIGYFIGSNLFLILGIIFLLIFNRLRKKLNTKKDQELIDSLFADEKETLKRH